MTSSTDGFTLRAFERFYRNQRIMGEPGTCTLINRFEAKSLRYCLLDRLGVMHVKLGVPDRCRYPAKRKSKTVNAETVIAELDALPAISKYGSQAIVDVKPLYELAVLVDED